MELFKDVRDFAERGFSLLEQFQKSRSELEKILKVVRDFSLFGDVFPIGYLGDEFPIRPSRDLVLRYLLLKELVTFSPAIGEHLSFGYSGEHAEVKVKISRDSRDEKFGLDVQISGPELIPQLALAEEISGIVDDEIAKITGWLVGQNTQTSRYNRANNYVYEEPFDTARIVEESGIMGLEPFPMEERPKRLSGYSTEDHQLFRVNPEHFDVTIGAASPVIREFCPLYPQQFDAVIIMGRRGEVEITPRRNYVQGEHVKTTGYACGISLIDTSKDKLIGVVDKLAETKL